MTSVLLVHLSVGFSPLIPIDLQTNYYSWSQGHGSIFENQESNSAGGTVQQALYVTLPAWTGVISPKWR